MTISTPAKSKRVVKDSDDLYPEGDGKPMAETDLHRQQMVDLIDSLGAYFADRPDVYVSGNNFLYWKEGDPRKCVSPDCYVVFGVEKRPRPSYMAWKEGGRLPSVVIEVTSKKTRREDRSVKQPLYEGVLRIPEYFRFDPTGDYLKPRLQGSRLVNGAYEPIDLIDGRLFSEQLSLELVWEGERLRLYDPAKGEYLPTFNDQTRRLAIANEEIARLKLELDRLRDRD